MPFCGKCGTKLEDVARFCPSCGSSVESQTLNSRGNEGGNIKESKGVFIEKESKPFQNLKAPGSAAESLGLSCNILVGILDLLILACLFMPWMALDLGVWADEYSVPDMFGMMTDSMSDSSFYEGFLSENVEVGIFFGCIFWAIAVCLIVFDIYRAFFSKSSRPNAGSFAAFWAAVFVLVISVSLSFETGLGSMDDYLSPSGWVYITLILSIVSFFACSKKLRQMFK